MTASEVLEEISRKHNDLLRFHNKRGNRVYIGKSELEALDHHNRTMVGIERYYESDKKTLMGMDLYIVDTEEPHIFVTADN